jgi:O-antigen/teichoic acid export membrane protein
MQPTAAPSDESGQRDQRLVLKNTAYLGIAEVLSGPLTIAINAMFGHYLGPANLGYIYFATTLCSAAILFVNWGHHGPLAAAVAVDRTIAGTLLGTSWVFRAVNSVVAFGILLGSTAVLNFSAEQRWAIGLVFLASVIGSFSSACTDVMRGFERTDVAAYMRVGSQLLMALFIIPVLFAGGGLRAALLVQALVGAIVLFTTVRLLGRLDVSELRWDWAAVKKLTVDGTSFVAFQLVIVLQPNIDAFYLAKLVPSEVVGWYAVSARLAGVLLIPAAALVGSLYPTLCRLTATNDVGYRQLVRDSIGAVSMVVFPLALGCAFYPDIGVMIFGRAAYRPAEDTLRFFAIQLALIYFCMPIGTAIIASGRQRTWTLVQAVCLVISLVLDPILIRYFQTKTGNGGAGLPVAGAISEFCIVTAGLWLLPKGIFDRRLLTSLALAGTSALCMGAAALALRQLTDISLLTAPVALMAYGLALYAQGAIRRDQLAVIHGFVKRKLKRD